VVAADEPEHVGGQLAIRVEAERLRDRPDAGQAQRADRRADGGRHLRLHPHERPVAREPLLDLGRALAEVRGERRRDRGTVADPSGQRVDRFDGGADGQGIAVAVEDRAALGAKGDGLRVLPLGEPRQLVVADDLQIAQPGDDRAEEKDEDPGQDERAAAVAGGGLRHGVRTRAGTAGEDRPRGGRPRPSGRARARSASPPPLRPHPVVPRGAGAAASRPARVTMSSGLGNGSEARGGGLERGGPALALRRDVLPREAHLIRPRRHEPESAGRRVDPGERAQRGELQLELPVLLPEPRAGSPEAVQLVRHAHPLDLEPDVAEHAGHDDAPEAQHPGHRAQPPTVPFADDGRGLILDEPRHRVSPRSRTRNRALRARGFVWISAASGRTGLRVSTRQSARASWRKAPFTRRSSREWNAITPNRPPGASSSAARGSATSRLPSSSFTAFRSAWNVRVAGWIRRGRRWGGMARVTTSASRPVVSIGARRRASTSRRAIRRAAGSSPYSRSSRSSSGSGARRRSSAAVRGCRGSNRMSSRSSRWNENPRPLASSWKEDSPRSSRTACAG